MHSHDGRLAGRFLKALAIGRGDGLTAQGYIEKSGWSDSFVLKAAALASSTGNASALLDQVGMDFMSYVRAESALLRLAGLRRVPFHTRIARQTTGPAAAWVGEHDSIPVMRQVFAKGDPLPALKVAAIAVSTLELARASDSENILIRDLSKAVREAMFASFIDPTNSGSAVEPQSVTYNATAISASTSAVADLTDAVEAMSDEGGDVSQAVWITHPVVYAQLILSRVASENGMLAGLPVITSSAVPRDTGGSIIALVDATGIELAGGDDAQLTVGTEGTLLFDDDPDGTGAPALVSLWSTESYAARAVVPVSWRARPGSVVYVDGANY